MGARPSPPFTWIAPPCPGETGHVQVAYQLVVSADGTKVWGSGKVASNESVTANYTGPALKGGTPYQWSVTTWTQAAAGGGGTPCESSASDPATFITALSEWNVAAKFISVAGPQAATFGYFRKEITVPAGVVTASAFVTGLNADPLLNGYKLYVNGHFVNNGPGRGEAPVWGGDGKFRSLPYQTLDVTAHLSAAGTAVVAIEAMHAGGAQALMQLQFSVGGGKVLTVGADLGRFHFDTTGTGTSKPPPIHIYPPPHHTHTHTHAHTHPRKLEGSTPCTMSFCKPLISAKS